MSVTTTWYSMVISEHLDNLRDIKQNDRGHIRQELYPLFGVIFGFVSMVFAHIFAKGAI
jgi:hypothetical protein